MRRLASLALALLIPVAAEAADWRDRPPADEVVYFVLPDRFANGDPGNDRGGLAGGRLAHGFDPTGKGFYQGGDLAGLTARLDYLQALGATAIWLGPIYRNKAVQGGPGQESAGYHGYWITDFTDVDPHFGTRAELKAFVDAAHARRMKVYLDIITNHTADVIGFAECAGRPECPYRSRADYPYSRRGGPGGRPINPGFAGDGARSAANFARLTDPSYAYTPVVPAAEAKVKVPAWLNEPIYYHNRGNTTFRNESSQHGDFVGLDDLFTEHPRVVQGMIDIYGKWIDDYGLDGFRIDTAQHVNPEFWQIFVPAMQERAKAKGLPNFHIFGEIAMDDVDPGRTARHTRVDRLPTVLDFAFAHAVIGTVAKNAPTSTLARLFAADALYEGGPAAALDLPTFLGNHDMGRFAHFVRKASPDAGDDEVLRRVLLGHAMLMYLRGQPVIYSGDEQGFAGDGNDQDARETLFASRVASYNDNRLVGTTRTTAVDNYRRDHPLYRALAGMAKLRAAEPALRRGLQTVRAAGDGPGLFAVTRRVEGGPELLVAFNTSDAPLRANVLVDTTSARWRSLAGRCAPRSAAPGSVEVRIPPLGHLVCAAR